MSKPRHGVQPKPRPPGPSPRFWSGPGVHWVLGLILAGAIIAAAVLSASRRARVSDASSAATPAARATNANPAAGSTWIPAERLVGRWVRPDGGYLLEIRGAQPDGRLDAGYFNPSPIRVARAESRREEDTLHVFVELRDVNYAGATYRLRYRPDQDRLEGEYFQPAFGQTFNVEFLRAAR